MKLALFIILLLAASLTKAEDGYNLWLRYKPVEDTKRLTEYKYLFSKISISGNSVTEQILKDELTKASLGMLNQKPLFIQ